MSSDLLLVAFPADATWKPETAPKPTAAQVRPLLEARVNGSLDALETILDLNGRNSWTDIVKASPLPASQMDALIDKAVDTDDVPVPVMDAAAAFLADMCAQFLDAAPTATSVWVGNGQVVWITGGDSYGDSPSREYDAMEMFVWTDDQMGGALTRLVGADTDPGHVLKAIEKADHWRIMAITPAAVENIWDTIRDTCDGCPAPRYNDDVAEHIYATYEFREGFKDWEVPMYELARNAISDVHDELHARDRDPYGD